MKKITQKDIKTVLSFMGVDIHTHIEDYAVEIASYRLAEGLLLGSSKYKTVFLKQDGLVMSTQGAECCVDHTTDFDKNPMVGIINLHAPEIIKIYMTDSDCVRFNKLLLDLV